MYFIIPALYLANYLQPTDPRSIPPEERRRNEVLPTIKDSYQLIHNSRSESQDKGETQTINPAIYEQSF